MALFALLRSFPGFEATLQAHTGGEWTCEEWPELVPLLNDRFRLDDGGPADPFGATQVLRVAALLGVTEDAIEWHEPPAQDSIKGRVY